jgi:short-subunit dehydrogenase
MKVRAKTIVVTGGGNGIGRELVLALLKNGAIVAAVDLREESLQETQTLAGENSKLSTHVLDITDKKAVEALPEQIITSHGVVDGIINNAGIIQPFVKVKELDYEAIDRVMNVNFFGALHMTKAFLPYLTERPKAHIVNVSSMGGFLPVPGQSVYGASKAAVKLLTEALYAELADTNIQVTVVFPGAIGTNITTNSGVEIPKLETDKKAKQYKTLSPKDAARIIIDGMEKNKFRVLVGNDAKMMDFLYRLSPKFATELIAKQMKSLLAPSDK